MAHAIPVGPAPMTSTSKRTALWRRAAACASISIFFAHMPIAYGMPLHRSPQGLDHLVFDERLIVRIRLCSTTAGKPEPPIKLHRAIIAGGDHQVQILGTALTRPM